MVSSDRKKKSTRTDVVCKHTCGDTLSLAILLYTTYLERKDKTIKLPKCICTNFNNVHREYFDKSISVDKYLITLGTELESGLKI